MVHTCPRCELRFTTSSELADHLELDHAADPATFERFRYRAKGSTPLHEGRRYLLVANETLHTSELLDRIRALAKAGPASFFIVVPTSTEDRVQGLASWRLREMVDRLHAEGIDAEGELGSHDPYYAVAEVLEREEIDEIVVSTLPPGLSKWLQADLSQRLERHFEVPVTTVTQTA